MCSTQHLYVTAYNNNNVDSNKVFGKEIEKPREYNFPFSSDVWYTAV